MTIERDTKFLGFAKLLQHEIWETEVSIVPMLTSGYLTSQVSKTLVETVQLLIAQRAYDLVRHAVIYGTSHPLSEIELEYITNSHIPDFTQWPES